ncbi:Chaperone protein dnaJ 10 [Babesia sp. Xinjiang]|uniref:Chaperone protein dnaJ 10 n=1 Tax=Babesia sp. Xinjiang TaxID=462227 RepID=UPI000A2387A2|nr:Chaperone protein dnaJ 10 [Babesia sp. Xinjiang]ORM42351.1 Chaperone protein dnaJ 10 [Babesia sp. Xinjiang]
MDHIQSTEGRSLYDPTSGSQTKDSDTRRHNIPEFLMEDTLDSKTRHVQPRPYGTTAAAKNYQRTPMPQQNNVNNGENTATISEDVTESDSDKEERVMKELTEMVGNSYYSATPYSFQPLTNDDTGDNRAAVDAEGMAKPWFDQGEPNGTIIQQAQMHLEKAEEDTRMRCSTQRETNRMEQLRNPIVMKTRGTEEPERLTNDSLLSNLFSMRNPRDAGAGIVSGIKSVTKGVMLGAASLVVCPVVGGHQNGVSGFVKGVGAGLLAAVTLPVTGVGIASYQITRGIINTPNAISQRVSGKRWNKQHGEWRDNWYSLEEEVKEVASAVKRQSESVRNRTDAANTAKFTSDGKVEVMDTELYDILDIHPSATQAEIKRQYYKLAKQYHPDKTGDASSAEKFMKLGEAYQVLGDEKRRHAYDQFGKSACDEMPILDSSLFFMMLFGSDDFEPYVGKLRMALYMELEADNRDYTPTTNDFEVAQWDREVKLALNLRDFVRPYVCGDLEQWYTDIIEKAKVLCTNSFSVELVDTIGWTYNNVANRFIGKWDTFLGIGGKVAKMQEQSKTLRKGVKAFTSMVKTAIAERSAQRGTSGVGERENMLNEEYMRNVCENSLPTIMDAMLNICLMDVQSTVKKAAKRILSDMAVDEHWRRKRAEGLGLMGRAFMNAAEAVRNRLNEEKQPLNMYDMFAQAADKAQQKKAKSQDSHVYRSDDGFF